jgi:hypothetical protein
MKYMDNVVRNGSWFSVGVAVAVVLLFGAVMVQGASTISTDISTGGALSVTGASTLTGAVWASSTAQVTGAVRNYGTLTQTGAATFTADATFDGGNDAVTLTHSNTATSSIAVGCIDTYATSTATPIRLMMGEMNASASSTYGGAGDAGFVVWGFGACS